MSTPIRILGIDPGLRHTGWGIVLAQGNALKYVAHGVISPKEKAPLEDRLVHLARDLEEVIQTFEPQEAAIEETFVNQNGQTTLKLGMARGVAFLAPARAGLKVNQYAPNVIKKTLVGTGHADKSQVSLMVQRLLSGCGLVTADAADALGIAICHAHHRETAQRWRMVG